MLNRPALRSYSKHVPMPTKRRTFACTAPSASRSVPDRQSWFFGDCRYWPGSAYQAAWITASAPLQARAHQAALSAKISGLATIVSIAAPRASVSCLPTRTTGRTRQPRSPSARNTWRPTNPAAPVSRINPGAAAIGRPYRKYPKLRVATLFQVLDRYGEGRLLPLVCKTRLPNTAHSPRHSKIDIRAQNLPAHKPSPRYRQTIRRRSTEGKSTTLYVCPRSRHRPNLSHIGRVSLRCEEHVGNEGPARCLLVCWC